MRMEREPLVLTHELVSAALPDMPADFALRAGELIASAPTERKMVVKRKLTFSMALALVLVLLCIGALAAVLLTPQEVVEQVAVPLAQGNDTEKRIQTEFAPEELAAVIAAFEENGFSLEENALIMDALRQGKGYDEEELIMAACRQAFGGTISDWTVAQQAWFFDRLVEIGFAEENTVAVPSPDEPTEAEAEQAAIAAAGTLAPAETPLADRAYYRLRRAYTRGEGDSPAWLFTFLPRDIWHDGYTVSLNHRLEVIEATVSLRFDTTPGAYTVPELYQALTSRCNDEASWSAAVWHSFDELAHQAAPYTPAQDEWYREELTAYLRCGYPLPADGDLTQEEATALAKAALPRANPTPVSAVLAEYEGQRVWLITLRYFVKPGPYVDKYESTLLELDSATGAVRSTRALDETVRHFAAFVPAAVYEGVVGQRLTAAEAVHAAAEAIRAQTGLDIPLEDESQFDIYFQSAIGQERQQLEFRARSLTWQTASAVVDISTGAVEVISCEQTPLTGDTILRRYWDAFGFWGEWPQATWAQLSRDMEGLTAQTLAGRILKATTYPEESAAAITREQAEQLVFEAADCRNGEINSCILMAAEPHAIWKLRLLPWDSAGTWLYEIDAQTGEVLDVDAYTPDNPDRDPSYRIWSPHRTWASLERAEYGSLYSLATTAIYHTFGDLAMDDPADYLPLEWGYYTYTEEGLTAHFAAAYSDLPDYEVRFNENCVPISVTEQPSSGTEPLGDVLDFGGIG